MNKRLAFNIILAVVAIAIVTISIEASAHKYKPKKHSAWSETSLMLAEKERSLTDCMTYSANHVSKGRKSDRSMFGRQFGSPSTMNGAVWTYNYDQYTRIVLDCSGSRCSCRCLQN